MGLLTVSGCEQESHFKGNIETAFNSKGLVKRQKVFDVDS